LQLKHDTPEAAADYGSGAVQSAMPCASHSSSSHFGVGRIEGATY
jgi:hypothetical protein